MDITGASGAIPRHDFKRLEAHAKRYYNEIRKRTDDIGKIAENSGFSIMEVQKIKAHIFFNKYKLGKKEYTSFDPSYDMAVSWQRLIEGRDIREMDMVMLNHELLESSLMNDSGLSYRVAHKIAEKKYNYTKYVKELDRKDGIL